MITIPIFRNWHVKTPALYRYMDQKYINEFFDTGRLRLSSFYLFAQHPDEERCDTEEGCNTLVGLGKEHTMLVRTQHGQRSLILCTSTIGNEDLMKAFGMDGYFRIKESFAFGTAIANRIPGFLEGIESPCIYADEHIIQRHISGFTLDDLKVGPESKDLSLDKLFAVTAQIGGADVFFMKHSRFAHQGEYRFVWNVCYDIKDVIMVECPEARQFCEKIT